MEQDKGNLQDDESPRDIEIETLKDIVRNLQQGCFIAQSYLQDASKSERRRVAVLSYLESTLKECLI